MNRKSILVDDDYTYPHYLDVCDKHLKVCKKMIEKMSLNSKDILLDIYYLCGYVLEGAFVYVLYKHNKWEPTLSIKKDSEMEKLARLRDIDPTNYVSGSYHKQLGVYYSWRNADAHNKTPNDNFLSIDKHNFQEYTKNLQTKFSGSSKPEMQIPYLNTSCKISPITKSLIDQWTNELRYFTSDRIDSLGITISEDSIRELVNTCNIIVSRIKYGNVL